MPTFKFLKAGKQVDEVSRIRFMTLNAYLSSSGVLLHPSSTLSSPNTPVPSLLLPPPPPHPPLLQLLPLPRATPPSPSYPTLPPKASHASTNPPLTHSHPSSVLPPAPKALHSSNQTSTPNSSSQSLSTRLSNSNPSNSSPPSPLLKLRNTSSSISIIYPSISGMRMV